MNINPGELKKKIIIIENICIKDKDGYDEETERIIHKCNASFKRTSGTEMFKSNADFGQEKARFLIRYTNKKITRKMAVKYNNDLYNISYINNYGDNNEYLEIWCDITEA